MSLERDSSWDSVFEEEPGVDFATRLQRAFHTPQHLQRPPETCSSGQRESWGGEDARHLPKCLHHPSIARSALLPLGRAPRDHPCVPGTPRRGQGWLCPPRVPLLIPPGSSSALPQPVPLPRQKNVSHLWLLQDLSWHGQRQQPVVAGTPRPLPLAQQAMGTAGAAGPRCGRAPQAGAPRRQRAGWSRLKQFIICKNKSGLRTV